MANVTHSNLTADHIALSAGAASLRGGLAVFSNSNGVSFGLNGSTMTASVARATGDYFDNLGGAREAGSNALGTRDFGAVTTKQALLFPVSPGGMPFDITANTVLLNVSISGATSANSNSWTSTFSLGIYTSTGATLNLLNSASVTFGFTANTNNSRSLVGQRYLSVHSSQWSSAPVFSQGVEYFGAFAWMSSVTSNASNTMLGMFRYSGGVSRSGTIGAGSVTADSIGFAPFYGQYSVTSNALPAAISNADLNKATAANLAFIPHMVLINNTAVSAF